MNELNIEKFSPTIAELKKLAEQAAGITLLDPLNKENVKIVKDMRLVLRDARTQISKMGKELREDAVKFQKVVIAKEHELVAIIAPEEDRLSGLEEEAARIQEREDRKEFLPRRRERIAAIGDVEDLPNTMIIELSDDALLDMDGAQFEGYLNARMALKNERDRKKLAEQQARIDAENAELKRKQDLAEAEERGRKIAQERAESERIAREAHTAEHEEEERISREMTERNGRYQAFLAEHGYNKWDFYTTQDIGGVITLWKKLAIFNPNE